MSSKKNEMTAGGMMGYQVPLAAKRKIEAFMEAIKLMETDRDIFLSNVSEQVVNELSSFLDAGKMIEAAKLVADKIEEGIVRNLVREKLREVVRKKKGGGGFVLYSPNQGKKRPPKAVGDFPTKLQAKRAELARFPPKDMAKLKRLRTQVGKLQKAPKKDKESKAPAEMKTKKEGLQLIRKLVEGVLIAEALPPGTHGKRSELWYMKDTDPYKSYKDQNKRVNFSEFARIEPEKAKGWAERKFGLGPDDVEFFYMDLGQAYLQNKDAHLGDLAGAGARLVADADFGNGDFRMFIWKDKIKEWVYAPELAPPGLTAFDTKKGSTTNHKKDAWKKDFVSKHGSDLNPAAVKKLTNSVVREALFREEESNASKWDERMVKLSKAALEADRKLQTLQKNIEKKSEGIISTAFQVIQKSLKPRKMQAKASGIKKDTAKQKSFMQFEVSTENVDVGPFYVYVESGKPKIEISDEAKKLLLKIQPETAKLLRAELITVQEDALDMMSDVNDAVAKRDNYLDKLEGKVDDFVSGLNATELSVLKSLLVNKYRGK